MSYGSKHLLEFKATFSACIVVYQDDACWAKSYFELTDCGTYSLVTVVTVQNSDDAIGCALQGQNFARLQVCRQDNGFAFHYSTNGENFYKLRCFTFPVGRILKVGVTAQALRGDGCI